MGMNIYTARGRKHIGKRYAAGIWCWDCKIRAEHDTLGLFWFCTECGNRCSERTLSFHPAYRELGFDKTPSKIRKGIDGASGFIWCLDLTYGIATNREDVLKRISHRKLVTEYGDKWSPKDFKSMFKDIIEEKESSGQFS